MTSRQPPTTHSAVDPTDDVSLVLPSFGSGGAERVVLNLARGLAATGAAVRLIVLDPTGPLRDQVPDGVEVVALDRPRVRTAGPALVRHLRARPPTIVLGSQTHLNVLLGALTPLMDRRTRLVLREPNLLDRSRSPNVTDRAIGRALGRADLVVASSPAMRDHLARSLPAGTRLAVIPNPVDVEALRRDATGPTGGSGPTEPSGPADRSAAHLVTVGRLVAQKGLEDLLRALATTSNGATLDVIGSGPLDDALRALAEDLGISQRIRFLGRIDDRRTVATSIAQADALVQPAHYEGMPNAVLEALALGVPVLATTDLTVLADLATEVEDGGLRLVPRASLASSIDDFVPLNGPTPRPSLLPARFGIDRVVAALRTALYDTGPAPDA